MRYRGTERLGVYTSGLIFTEKMDWIFREQPIMDVGIDALIEMTEGGNPNGRFLAAQIKTGKSNFHITKQSLTLYVSRMHYEYWLCLSIPIILIAYLPKENLTCWEHIDSKNLIKTNKKYKISIPKGKILDNNSIIELTKIINGHRGYFDSSITTRSFPTGRELGTEPLVVFNHCTEYMLSIGGSLLSLQIAKPSFDYIILQYLMRRPLSINRNSKELKENLTKCSKILIENSKSIYTDSKNFVYYFAKGLATLQKISMNNYIGVKDTKFILIMESLLAEIDHLLVYLNVMKNLTLELPDVIEELRIPKQDLLENVNFSLNEFELAKKVTNKLLSH